MADKYLGAHTYENTCPDTCRFTAYLALKSYNSSAQYTDKDFGPELYGTNIHLLASALIIGP